MPENIASAPTNIPEFSVSDLALSLKRTLEETYGRVRVRGELSKVMIAGSGHMYSALKDDGAVIDAVCWKGTLSKLSVKPEEGLEVICTGRISTYPARSNYQLIIESMELAGEGALLKMLEERKKKLAAEGLFDPARKRPIPFLPDVIGVVTSPTGAVIRDILHRLNDRFPRHVIVWPVLVQGQGAAEQVAAAIRGFQEIDRQGLPRPDVLIVARGGGALEDLMPFNEEIVVRAAAESKIPLISAVGHETDTTLIDYAADRRAPTPTGAAEMAVPVRGQLMAQILDDEKRLLNATTRMLSEYHHRLQAQGAKLGDPAKLLETQTQRLDHMGERMAGLFREYLAVKSHQLVNFAAALRHPRDRLAEAQQKLARWQEQLGAALRQNLRDWQKHLKKKKKLLQAYSFENVLERGFAVVRGDDGKLLPDATHIRAGQTLHIQFRQKQTVEATAKGAPEKTVKPKKSDKNQTSLF